MVKKILVVLCCLGFIVLAFTDVNGFVDAARRGVLLFGRNVMPVLFPFFFVSGLLVEVGFFRGFKRFGFAAPIFTLSVLSGFPTGARILRDLYVSGEITRTKALRIATYTSTTSPIFIIATLGACFYQSVTVGVLIFTAHVLGAVANGVLFCRVRFQEGSCVHVGIASHSLAKTGSSDVFARNAVTKQSLSEHTRQNDISTAISNSLYSAVQNILAVGGLIIIFFIVTQMVGGGLIVSSLLEMTTGLFIASTTVPMSIILPTAIVTFGGACVAMQGFVFMNSFRMPLWFYLLYKTTHTIFAVGFCLLLIAIFC